MRANHADHPFGELYCWDCGEPLKIPKQGRNAGKIPRRCKKHQEKLNYVFRKRRYGKPE